MSKEEIWNLVAKKLAGEASPEELKELEELLRKDPDFHYALQNISDIWQLKPPANKDASDAFRRHIDRLKESGLTWDDPSQNKDESLLPGTRKKGRVFIPLLALSIVFLFAAILFYTRKTPGIPYNTVTNNIPVLKKVNEIHTNKGSKMKVTLPDGSLVWLNAGSRLIYEKSFGEELREVELSGEAYFDVTQNKKIPFVIHTDAINIRVTGTAFNVKSYPGDRTTETSLIRGTVEVSLKGHPNEKYFLKPNDRLVLTTGTVVKQDSQKPTALHLADPVISMEKVRYEKDDSLSSEICWIDNKLSFVDEPLEDVARKVERWYDVEINIENPKLKSNRLNVTYTNETLDQVLESLEYAVQDFHYRINNRKVTIY